MPKVLRIINRFNLGGPTFNAAYLSKYMAPEYETLLVGGSKDPSEAGSEFIVQSLGLEPLIIEEMRRSPGISGDWSAYRKIRKLIRDFKPDIVHTHASKAGALGRLAAHREGVKAIVHTFHGNVFKGYFGPVKNSVYKNLERHLAQRTHAIVAISELQKKELAEEHRICKPEKIHVVPLGFDLSRFRQNKEEKRKNFRRKWGIGEDEIVISIVGRLVPIKNHILFLDALQSVLKRVDVKIKALIVGDGESGEEIRRHADAIGLTGSSNAPLLFTSWIKEIDEVNAASDIICLSSLNEGTPVSLIEAQAAGTPVVSTDVGGIRDIVLPGKTALLSPSGDADALAANLLQLVDSPEKRSEMSALGWAFVEERFHYTRLVRDMKLLYEQLLREKH